jgi:hypothetical protein
VPFNCLKYPAFAGDILQHEIATTYFTDSSGTDNETYGTFVFSNPFFFGVSGWTLPAAGGNLTLSQDTEFIALEYGGLGYLMLCNATIFDTQYTVINGAITSFEMSPSNESVTILMIQPSSSTITGSIKLEDAANLAALSTTPLQFADIFSLAYSRVLLSLVAGVVVPSPTLELQQH